MSTEILAALLGIASGGLLGILGAGGSVLTVPALVYLLDQPVGAATTASLAIVSANAAVGAAINARSGTLDARVAARFAPASVVGALAGSYLNRLAGGETVLFLLALMMLLAARSLWGGREADAGARRRPPPGIAIVAAIGFTIGVLTGFFGVGGGFLIVPALAVLLGMPLRVAIGTSLLVIAVTALAGLGGHLASGGVSWSITISFGAAGLVGTWLGARASRRVASDQLSRAFSLMLVVVAAFLLVRNAGAVLG